VKVNPLKDEMLDSCNRLITEFDEMNNKILNMSQKSLNEFIKIYNLHV
jgi:hypothetical protein